MRHEQKLRIKDELSLELTLHFIDFKVFDHLYSDMGRKAKRLPEGSIARTGTAGERRVAGLTEIVHQLVSGAAAGRDVNLNALKLRVARDYGLDNVPRLVDIIAAVPEEHKAV